MTKEEVKTLFKRINSHYSNFDTLNTDKFKEWLKYLSDYESSSINYQLDKYLKSDYAKYEPKVDNLIRFAKKVKETNKPIYVRCQFCGESVLLQNYDRHIERENSVDYMQKMAKKHLDKNIDIDKYTTMAQELFDEKYNKLMVVIKNNLVKEIEDNEEKDKFKLDLKQIQLTAIKKILGENYENV